MKIPKEKELVLSQLGDRLRTTSFRGDYENGVFDTIIFLMNPEDEEMPEGLQDILNL